MICLVIVLALLLLYYYIHLSYTQVYNYWKTRGVLGPTPWPLFGNYGPVLFRIKTENQVLRKLYNDYPKEKFIGFFIGSQPALLLREPELVKQILCKDHDVFSDRYSIDALQEFKKSLFLARTNESWKPIRTTVINLLNEKQVARLVPKIETAINESLDVIGNIIDTNPVQDIYHLLKTLNLTVVSKAILGIDLKEEFITMSFKLEYLFGFEWVRVLHIIFPRITKIFKPLIVFFGNIFTNYYARLSTIAFECCQNFNLKSVDTFADFLLRSQENHNINKLDAETLAMNLGTVIVAVFEAVSTISSCLLFEMALNQEIQNRCYEEIYQLYTNSDIKVSYESLLNMQYLDMVLKETLRRYQISLTLDRICDTKYRFQDTDVMIDRGVHIYISAEALHGDDEYFPDPGRFVPERFETENRDKIPPGAYIPFADGPRRCIGPALVRLITKMAIPALKFKLDTLEKTPKKVKIINALRTRRIDNELWVKFSRR